MRRSCFTFARSTECSGATSPYAGHLVQLLERGGLARASALFPPHAPQPLAVQPLPFGCDPPPPASSAPRPTSSAALPAAASRPPSPLVPGSHAWRSGRDGNTRLASLVSAPDRATVKTHTEAAATATKIYLSLFSDSSDGMKSY
jgi:hypothetical protein